MILYNVTVQTDPEIEQDWIRWMQQEHIPEILATGLFTEARLCRLTGQEADSAPTYAAQYFLPSQGAYDRYLTEYAPLMRQKGLDRFGSRFVAFRTVLEVLSTH